MPIKSSCPLEDTAHSLTIVDNLPFSLCKELKKHREFYDLFLEDRDLLFGRYHILLVTYATKVTMGSLFLFNVTL